MSAFSWLLIKLFRLSVVIVIYYHSIDDYNWKHSVLPGMFIKQLKWLMNRANIVTLDEVYGHANGSKKLSGLNVAITFDDGYKDFIENVFPFISRNNIPVSIFLSTNEEAVTSMGNGKTRIFINDFEKTLKTDLVKVYSHGHDHVNLTQLSEERLNNELQKSLTIIKNINLNENQFFCYPFGYRNDLVVKTLKENGFVAGFGISQGVVRFHDESQLFKIKRVQIEKSTSMIEFVCKMSLAVEWYEDLRLVFRRYVKN